MGHHVASAIYATLARLWVDVSAKHELGLETIPKGIWFILSSDLKTIFKFEEQIGTSFIFVIINSLLFCVYTQTQIH